MQRNSTQHKNSYPTHPNGSFIQTEGFHILSAVAPSTDAVHYLTLPKSSMVTVVLETPLSFQPMSAEDVKRESGMSVA